MLFNLEESVHLEYITWKIVSLYITGKINHDPTLNRNKN